MLSLPDALRPSAILAAARRPVPVALALGAVCVLGSAGWVAGSLFAPAEPPPAKVLFSRLDDWPEIKNGVPDLKRAAPALAAEALPPSPEARRAPAPEAPPADRPGVRPTPPETPASAQEVQGSRPEPPPAAAADVRTPEASEGGPAAVAAAVVPSLDAPAASGAAPAPRPSIPTEAASTAGGAKARRTESAGPRRPEGDRAGANGRTPPSAARREGEAATRKANNKPARPERERVAAAPSRPPEDVPAPSAPAQADAAAPEDDRVRVLGVPLPSGRKVKECLLEFRC